MFAICLLPAGGSRGAPQAAGPRAAALHSRRRANTRNGGLSERQKLGARRAGEFGVNREGAAAARRKRATPGPRSSRARAAGVAPEPDGGHKDKLGVVGGAMKWERAGGWTAVAQQPGKRAQEQPCQTAAAMARQYSRVHRRSGCNRVRCVERREKAGVSARRCRLPLREVGATGRAHQRTAVDCLPVWWLDCVTNAYHLEVDGSRREGHLDGMEKQRHINQRHAGDPQNP